MGQTEYNLHKIRKDLEAFCMKDHIKKVFAHSETKGMYYNIT